MRPIEVAIQEYQLNIIDPPEGYYIDRTYVYDRNGRPVANCPYNYSRIMTYIEHGPVKHPKQRDFYSNDSKLKGYYAWCGAFVSFCYSAWYQGDRSRWASTSNLFSEAKEKGWLVPLTQMQPGDIIGVGKGNPRHLGMFYTSQNGVIYTIEGNTISNGREGVCFRTRVFGSATKDGILMACRPPMLTT